MKVYFDKANILSFVKSKDKNLYLESLRLLKKQVNMRFNFSKHELINDLLLSAWMNKELSQGLLKSIEFGPPFPERPLKSNTAGNFSIDELMSVYLLDDVSNSRLKNSGSVITGEPGEELSLFGKLFLLKDDYDFKRTWRIKDDSEFRKWDDLVKYSTPVTDIIIIDRYVLSDIDLINANLLSLLKCLSVNCKVKLNIVIVTSSRPGAVNIDLFEARNRIRAALEEVTGKKPMVTIVKSKAEHDRTVITNYLRIHTGDTLNYWNSSGEVITDGKEMHYFSLAKSEDYEFAQKAIDDVQKAINWLEENNRDYIFGDKKSGFLKFQNNE